MDMNMYLDSLGLQRKEMKSTSSKLKCEYVTMKKGMKLHYY